jgi:IS5 family transposase
MFKGLLLQAMHGLSDERCEYLIKGRLSFMRFLGLGLADAVPNANTIWTLREALKRADAVQALFQRFDATLKAAGYLAIGGQIVDATIVAAPKQRNTETERAAIKTGQIPEGWAEKPAKLQQKDRDPRWTVGSLVRLAVRQGSGSLPGITTSPNPYRGFQYPAEVIQHAVWLYHCFSLSLRDVELILAA